MTKKALHVKGNSRDTQDRKGGTQVLKYPHSTAYIKPQCSLVIALVYILVYYIKNKSGHLFLT